MKFRKIFTVLFLAGAFVAAVSCDDDEDDTTKESLSGSISLPLPDYMLKGSSKTFKLDTLTTLARDDEQAIGYYFKDPETGTYDTLVYDGGIVNPEYPDGVFTVYAPDSLGSFSSILTGFTDGYYVSAASSYFDTVDPSLSGKGTITGFDTVPTENFFTDPRDNYNYSTVRYAGLEWMRQNLVWEGAGIPYLNADAMSQIFGRYCTWTEASTACPEGWRLPTDAEWKSLGNAANIMGDLCFNGDKMWEYWPAVKIDNVTGLTVIPVGYALGSGSSAKFVGKGTYAAFWTSDRLDDNAIFRYIYHDNNTLFCGDADVTSFRASVRCVRYPKDSAFEVTSVK